jgi:hypothetical protein
MIDDKMTLYFSNLVSGVDLVHDGRAVGRTIAVRVAGKYWRSGDPRSGRIRMFKSRQHAVRALQKALGIK